MRQYSLYAMQLKAVIFDMDGLMLDTESVARKMWLGEAERMGIDVGEELYRKLIGRTYADIGDILRDALKDDDLVQRYMDNCLKVYEEHIAQPIAQKPGLEKMLSFCDEKGLRKGVGTSSGRSLAVIKLRSGGIEGRFNALVGGCEVSNGKPHPEIFQKVAATLGVPPEECLVLEDSPSGVLAAHAAGARVIMIPDMIEPEEHIRAAADAVLTSLAEVPAYMLAKGWVA